MEPQTSTATLTPTTPLAATLTAQEWNIVLDVLSDGRYRVVAAIIHRLQTQLVARGQQIGQQAGNGLDLEPLEPAAPAAEGPPHSDA